MASIITQRLKQAVAIHSHFSSNDPCLLVSSWWRDDPRPLLESIEGFEVWRCINASLIAKLAGITTYEASKRLSEGHRLYIGWLNEQPVAYGWSATRQAEIGEIESRFPIPSGDRYLWDFATLPEWRGYGLYPRLLQAMLASESEEAARLWIAYLPENVASQRGIAKAGFRPVGAIVGTPGQPRFQSSNDDRRGALGAALLRLPRHRTIARAMR